MWDYFVYLRSVAGVQRAHKGRKIPCARVDFENVALLQPLGTPSD